MSIQMLLIAFIVAFSVASAILYVLFIIIYTINKTAKGSPLQIELDIILKHVIGILSITTAIMSVIYLFMVYPMK